MKKCLIMFGFFVLSLLLAAITESSGEFLADKITTNEVVFQNQIPDRILNDNIQKE